jgi:hypothetical protein
MKFREGKLKSKAFPTFINKSASELRITTVDSDPDPSSDEVDEAEANTSIDSLATPIVCLRL